MPYDPMTGQDLPYSNSYSSQGMQTPLIADVTNNMPGMLAMMAIGQRRGANTIMRGGFLDKGPVNVMRPFSGGLQRNNALRRFQGNNLTGISSGGRFSRGSYAGPLGMRKQRAAKMMAQMAGETIETTSGAASRFGGKHAAKLNALKPRFSHKRISTFFKTLYS